MRWAIFTEIHYKAHAQTSPRGRILFKGGNCSKEPQGTASLTGPSGEDGLGEMVPSVKSFRHKPEGLSMDPRAQTKDRCVVHEGGRDQKMPESLS